MMTRIWQIKIYDTGTRIKVVLDGTDGAHAAAMADDATTAYLSAQAKLIFKPPLNVVREK